MLNYSEFQRERGGGGEKESCGEKERDRDVKPGVRQTESMSHQLNQKEEKGAGLTEL